MPEEIIETTQTTDGADDIQKYIDTIADLKANSVSKSEAERLRAENRTLLQAIEKGQTINSTPVEAKKSIAELRAKLTGPDHDDLSDIDYIETVLDLREALIEEAASKGYEYDPFCPQGKQYDPSEEDKKTAEKVAAGLQSILEVANGDCGVFSREVARIVQDAPIANTKRNLRR